MGGHVGIVCICDRQVGAGTSVVLVHEISGAFHDEAWAAKLLLHWSRPLLFNLETGKCASRTCLNPQPSFPPSFSPPPQRSQVDDAKHRQHASSRLANVIALHLVRCECGPCGRPLLTLPPLPLPAADASGPVYQAAMHNVSSGDEGCCLPRGASGCVRFLPWYLGVCPSSALVPCIVFAFCPQRAVCT